MSCLVKYFLVTFELYTVYIRVVYLVTFELYTVYIRVVYGLHSSCIRVTFELYSGYIRVVVKTAF